VFNFNAGSRGGAIYLLTRSQTSPRRQQKASEVVPKPQVRPIDRPPSDPSPDPTALAKVKVHPQVRLAGLKHIAQQRAELVRLLPSVGRHDQAPRSSSRRPRRARRRLAKARKRVQPGRGYAPFALEAGCELGVRVGPDPDAGERLGRAGRDRVGPAAAGKAGVADLAQELGLAGGGVLGVGGNRLKEVGAEGEQSAELVRG